MTGSVHFTAAALADLDETAAWYNKQRPMLGVQFLEAVRETTNRIAANPKAFRVVAEDVRRANLPRRWPYALWYLIVEPRLRQIRDALDALGIESTHILHHVIPRIFYGCELHPGAREELLGLVPTTSTDAPVASVVASAWRERWLSSRIKNEEVMDRLQTANAEAIQFFFQAAIGTGTTEPVADLFSEVASGN